jgi:predicted transcriptional regulator
LSAMEEKDFDANERIAGFSLLSVKKAIQLLAMSEDGDDVKHVSTALKCGRDQAQRVLEKLEERGLVEKTSKRSRWKTTALGVKLAFHWHPPRTFRPAIRYGNEAFVVSEHFASTECSIWRCSPDEEAMFEEAELHVAMNPEYEGERLIEVEVVQPDEYQGEIGGGGESALALHISPTAARTMATGLLNAAERAEHEVERRAKVTARREKRKAGGKRSQQQGTG